MQKGDDNQRLITSEYSTATLGFNIGDQPYTNSIGSTSDVLNYNDIAKVLSQVELPSPSPAPATSCSFQEGQSSAGAKMVDHDQIEGNINEEEKELKEIHEDLQEPTGKQFQAHQTRGTRQRRRSRIHEKIRTLKELVPNCNKRDQASILDDAISHITTLQLQVQTMQLMGAGTMPQGLYMSPWRHPSFQGPYVAPYFNMGHYGSYVTPFSPVYPPFAPLVPPMQVGTDSPRLLPNPHLQYSSQTSKPAYSATLSSNAFIATASSQVGSGISSQSPYHMPPITSQEQEGRMIDRE